MAATVLDTLTPEEMRAFGGLQSVHEALSRSSTENLSLHMVFNMLGTTNQL